MELRFPDTLLQWHTLEKSGCLNQIIRLIFSYSIQPAIYEWAWTNTHLPHVKTCIPIRLKRANSFLHMNNNYNRNKDKSSNNNISKSRLDFDYFNSGRNFVSSSAHAFAHAISCSYFSVQCIDAYEIGHFTLSASDTLFLFL